MANAGYCDECGGNVWIGPDGSCASGHGPEHVSGHYDAAVEPVAAPEQAWLPGAPAPGYAAAGPPVRRQPFDADGMAIASVGLAAVGVVAFWCISFVSLIFGVAGLIFGILGLKSQRRRPLAVFGIVLNSLVIAVVVAMFAFAMWVLIVGGSAMP
jgi:hypothetical protein